MIHIRVVCVKLFIIKLSYLLLFKLLFKIYLVMCEKYANIMNSITLTNTFQQKNSWNFNKNLIKLSIF